MIAAGVTLGWCLFAIWLGPRVGFVDRPDNTGLKPHTGPVVPLGGVGVFACVHVSMAFAGTFDVLLVAASGLVLLLGLADDRWPLSALVRLGVEIAAGLLLGFRFFGGDVVTVIVVTVLVVIAVNAVNLFDGLDGLAGSATLVTGLGLAWLAAVRGIDPVFGVALAGAALGFLVLNWQPAKVFLGDNGSYVIGVFVAYGILDVAPSIDRLAPGLLLLGVFALDLAATVIRRRSAGRSLFAGDRSHLYDQLHDRGMSVRVIAAAAASVQAVFVVAAVLIDRISEPTMTWVPAVAVGVVGLVAVALGGFLRE